MAGRASPIARPGQPRRVELEALLRALDRLPDVIWAADGDRIFTYLSAGAEEVIGYRPEELVGRSSEIVMHESSREAFEAGYRWQIAHPDGDHTYRVNLRHRDGHAVPVELHNIGTPLDGRYGGGTGSVREISATLRLERELQEQAAELAASRERGRLAQELHDSVTQALFTMTITAGAARMLIERGRPGVEGKLDEISALGREALAEMRSLILELRPGSLADDGFVRALQNHLGDVERRTGLAIRLDLGADLAGLPPPVEDALYRITQEAVHNAVKHARASEVRVGVRRTSGCVRLEIRDDGAGFDPRARQAGLGLQGMAGRAARLGGSVKVESAPGQGTLVTAVIPTGSRAADGG
jgi:PAS domain S-box-containing protein